MAKIFRGKLPEKEVVELMGKRKRKGLSNNSIGFRLELYRVYLEMTPRDIAELINITQSSYSDLQSGNNSPSCQTIINLFNLEENPVDVRWLLCGEA